MRLRSRRWCGRSRISRHSQTKTLKPYDILIAVYGHFTKSVQKIAETAELVREGITNLDAVCYFDWPDKLGYARGGRRWWWNWNWRQIGIIAWQDVQYYSCRAILLPSGGQNINTQWRIRNVCFAPSPLPTKLSLCICEWESSSPSANHLQEPKTFPVKKLMFFFLICEFYCLQYHLDLHEKLCE